MSRPAVRFGAFGLSKKTTKVIEVFRPGTFTPMTGEAITFSANDLRGIAADYDSAASPAPIVVGHPITDAPAYGWANSFSYDEESGRLIAEIGEIEPAFSDAVGLGRYKKISLSLFAPTASNNPMPGKWYPKHIGFLGAAAPAVSGLKPVAFSGADDGIVTFEFADASALRDVAGLFRSLREWMIEKFGSETADKAVPNWTIGWIEDAAERDPPTINEGPFFTAPSIKPKTTPETNMDPAKKAADDAAFAAREKALTAREQAANNTDNLAFAEKLVTEGRLLPVSKDKVVGILNALSPVASAQLEVSFADGNATKTSGALDLIKSLLESQPPVVSFGSVVIGDDVPSVDFAMPHGMSADQASADLHARAVAYQAVHPNTEYMTAVTAVNR